jgi:hypothetical protein
VCFDYSILCFRTHITTKRICVVCVLKLIRFVKLRGEQNKNGTIHAGGTKRTYYLLSCNGAYFLLTNKVISSLKPQSVSYGRRVQKIYIYLFIIGNDFLSKIFISSKDNFLYNFSRGLYNQKLIVYS